MEQLRSGQKEPLMMSGPKFDQSGGWWNWVKNNRSNIILTIIGILIIAGGIYLYSNYQNSGQVQNPEEISQQSQENEIVTPDQINIEGEKTAESVAGQSQASKEKTQAVKIENGIYTIKALKGAGVTHLARKALAEYLDENPELKKNLKAEQKIYIEDTLKRQAGSYPLKIGQELTFKDNQIKEAVDKSQKLTEKQLQNLHKYVLLVPSL